MSVAARFPEAKVEGFSELTKAIVCLKCGQCIAAGSGHTGFVAMTSAVSECRLRVPSPMRVDSES